MKSWASYEAKVNYYARTLNRPLRKEELFPMFLQFNYNSVIRPRLECLRSLGNKDYDLPQILPCSDEEFCLRYGVDKALLKDKQDRRPANNEKDVFWMYAHGV